MEITWYGHACFRLKGREGIVITDPYHKSLGLTLPSLKSNIVTISHDTPHHNYTAGVKGDFKVVDSPGEYEINSIFVTSIYMRPDKKNKQEQSGRNNVFVIDIEEITVCHLGDISHVPTQSQVEDMGSIDVLLVPVGGKSALNATQAAEVISLIEPYVVIPMHYNLPNLTIEFDPVSKFLKEMGISKMDTVDSLKITKSGLPQETQVVVLEAKQ
jgi:L-ascorbate metabolism protein UlaG (beta-lactamase superfamily)